MPTLTCAGVRTLGLSSASVYDGVHRRHLGQRLDQREADEVRERDLAAATTGEVVVDDDAVVDHQLGRDGAHRGGRGDLERGLHVGHDARGRAAQLLDVVGGLGLVGLATRAGRPGRTARWRAGRSRSATSRPAARRTARPAPAGSAAGAAGGGRRRGRRGRRRRATTGVGFVAGVPLVVRPASSPWSRAVGRGLVGLVALEEVPPRGVDRVLVLEVLLVQLVHEPLVGAENGTGRVRIRLLGHAGIAHFRCGS